MRGLQGAHDGQAFLRQWGVRIRVFLCAECEGDGDDAFMAWLKGQCAVIAASRDWSQVPGVAMVPEENIER